MFGTLVHISVPLLGGHNNPDCDISKSKIVDLRLVLVSMKRTARDSRQLGVEVAALHRGMSLPFFYEKLL